MNSSAEIAYFKSISDFIFLKHKPIGKGSFGEVKLAMHIVTNKIYAIKIVKVCEVNTQVGLMALERETAIHSSVDHPHIVRLWQVLEDSDSIYMVMQYVEGGNLFYYQNQHKIFSEEKASIFFLQTLSALEYLHSLDLIHRDLKPENLLLDNDQNLKICDFGWIAEGINEKRKTFCGTYEYMAPEMIFDRHYDYRVDIWALGILLYELLHGFAPFEGDNAEEVRRSMMNGKLKFDPDLSSSAQDLIFNILKVNADERIEISEIKKHKWVLEMIQRKTDAIENFQLKMSEQLDGKQSLQKHNSKEKSITNEKGRQKSAKVDKSLRQKEQKLKHQTLTLKLKEKKKILMKSKNRIETDFVNISKTSKDKSSTNKENSYNLLHSSSKMPKKNYKYIQPFGIASKIGHRLQISDFSDLKKKSRLKTDLSENKPKKEIVRLKTEMSEAMEFYAPVIISNIKKKKSSTKNLPVHKQPNFLRKSIE